MQTKKDDKRRQIHQIARRPDNEQGKQYRGAIRHRIPPIRAFRKRQGKCHRAHQIPDKQQHGSDISHRQKDGCYRCGYRISACKVILTNYIYNLL